MFDLALSDEQSAVADVVRDLALRLVSPAAAQAERERAVPSALWQTLTETGMTAPVAEVYGGGGVPDALTHVIAAEGLAYGDPGIAMAALWGGVAALLIGSVGTSEQAKAFLPAFLRYPARRSTVALYEGFGRAPSEYKTTISPTSAGRWRVAGAKVGVAFGSTADPLIVVGVSPADGRLRAAIITGAEASPAPAHGHLALDAAELRNISFDTEVGDEALVGGPSANTHELARVVTRLRLLVAAAAIGTARRAVEYAGDYARGRVAFGKPIAAFQGVSFLLAEAMIRLDATRFEVWDVAGQIDPDERVVSEAVNYACVVATDVTRDAVQVLGGHGFITDHPVERWYRSAAALSALDFDPTCSSFQVAL